MGDQRNGGEDNENGLEAAPAEPRIPWRTLLFVAFLAACIGGVVYLVTSLQDDESGEYTGPNLPYSALRYSKVLCRDACAHIARPGCRYLPTRNDCLAQCYRAPAGSFDREIFVCALNEALTAPEYRLCERFRMCLQITTPDWETELYPSGHE